MFDPKRWLSLAAEKIPVLWYAIGVAGIIVAVAIIHKLVPDFRLETLLMVVVGTAACMVLLIIVSWVGRTPSEGRRPVATIFLWSVCVLAITLMVFTFTAFVFEWPSRWAEVVAPRSASAQVGIPSPRMSTHPFRLQDRRPRLRPPIVRACRSISPS